MLTFEVPGMDKKDIHVSVRDRVLTISGNREFKTEDDTGRFVRREIATGSFERQFTLPQSVDPNSVKAEYKNGILEVRLDKTEESKPKEIDVKVS